MQTIYLLDHTHYYDSYKASMLMLTNEDYETVCNKLNAVEASYNELYNCPCIGLEDAALKKILNRAYGYEFIKHKEVPYRKLWARLYDWFNEDDCSIDTLLNYKFEAKDSTKYILQYIDIHQNWEVRANITNNEYINDPLKKIITEIVTELGQTPKY